MQSLRGAISQYTMSNINTEYQNCTLGYSERRVQPDAVHQRCYISVQCLGLCHGGVPCGGEQDFVLFKQFIIIISYNYCDSFML